MAADGEGHALSLADRSKVGGVAVGFLLVLGYLAYLFLSFSAPRNLPDEIAAAFRAGRLKTAVGMCAVLTFYAVGLPAGIAAALVAAVQALLGWRTRLTTWILRRISEEPVVPPRAPDPEPDDPATLHPCPECGGTGTRPVPLAGQSGAFLRACEHCGGAGVVGVAPPTRPRFAVPIGMTLCGVLCAVGAVVMGDVFFQAGPEQPAVMIPLVAGAVLALVGARFTFQVFINRFGATHVPTGVGLLILIGVIGVPVLLAIIVAALK
jgi:hypothetical protein